jgi:hypothetical protein
VATTDGGGGCHSAGVVAVTPRVTHRLHKPPSLPGGSERRQREQVDIACSVHVDGFPTIAAEKSLRGCSRIEVGPRTDRCMLVPVGQVL